MDVPQTTGDIVDVPFDLLRSQIFLRAQIAMRAVFHHNYLLLLKESKNLNNMRMPQFFQYSHLVFKHSFHNGTTIFHDADLLPFAIEHHIDALIDLLQYTYNSPSEIVRV